MAKKLGKNITIINSIAVIFVILIGGISIFLTKSILHNGYKIEEESRHIKIFDDLNTDAYRLVLNLHHFLIDPGESYYQEINSLISSIETTVIEYRAEEEAEEYEESEKEVEVLNGVIGDINNLKHITLLFKEYSETGDFDRGELIRYEEFVYHIESAAKEINHIHFNKISQWGKESISKMWMILYLYAVFIIFGGLSILIGHRLLLKNIANPIKELSAATIEFAEGTLDKRVHTHSRTEIGLLFQSFNKMAEKLQENDEFLRNFNEELEKKVIERTLELQEANEQLRSTQNALIRTEKIAAIGQIAAGVTHEVRNPLNALSINTQMLMKEFSDKLGPDSQAYESASKIRFEVNRINNILEEFINYAKFPEPQFFDNNVNHVIKEVADFISESAKDSNVTINLSLQEDIPVFRFDARQFKEVLINLSHNAIKAMKDGGSLDIKTGMDNTDVIIKVSDTGDGISDNNLENIFSPFFSSREGGLGLGLPIVQKIIESHNGKIGCSSQVGAGTTFEIILPVKRG